MVTRAFVKFVAVCLVTIGVSIGLNWYLLSRFARRAPMDSAGMDVAVESHRGGRLQGAAQRNWGRLLDMDLTQRKELVRLEGDFARDLRQLETELAKTRMTLCHVLRQDPKGVQDVSPYIQSIARLHADQERRIVGHLMQVRRFLRPDQDQRLFTTLMQDICVGCRAATAMEQCLCGMCEMGKGQRT